MNHALPEPDWVFGYGSLIWNPGFTYRSACLARLHGWHRRFCIRSVRYRGTAQQPGVVLGLAQGGSCIGMAFELEPGSRQDAVRALFDREMPGGYYAPRMVPVHRMGAAHADHAAPSATNVLALTFVANTRSEAFVQLPETEILRRLHHCVGERGPNRDYALLTHASLQAKGVRCKVLETVAGQLSAAGSGSVASGASGALRP